MPTYWAAEDDDKIASKIKDKFEAYQKWMESSGYANRIKAVYNRYYSLDSQGLLKIERDQNDIARIDVNHMRSLVRRMHIIVTENKLAFDTESMNTDSQSMIESDAGRVCCEYYGEEKDMNATLSDAVLMAIIMLEANIHCPWDISEGLELTVDENNQAVRSGDQKFEILSAFNVARSTSAEDSPWRIVRTICNKWDLAAIHPEHADYIQMQELDRDENDLSFSQGSCTYVDDEDFCYKFTLYHKRTSALESGRWVEVVGDRVIFSDQGHGLIYDDVPVERMTAGKILEGVAADSPAVDLVGIQEAMNALFSGTLTNNLNNCEPVMWSPDPNTITRRLENGTTLINSAQKPEMLNFTASAAENFKMLDMLVSSQQLLSGINDVARGNPSSNLKSGASLALVLTQAIEYVSNIQKSYARCAGAVGTHLISNLKKFGPDQLIESIIGSTEAGNVKTFKRQNLIDIKRVKVDLGNPVFQTYAGRAEFADKWLQQGVMKSPKQMEAFIRTGNLDQVTEDDFGDEVLIRDENEQLRKGQKPPVLLLDMHAEHIQRHKSLMNSIDARQNPDMVKACLAHIQEHINTMRQVPPDMAAVIAGQPLPPLAPPPGADGPMPGNPLDPGPKPVVDGARMPSMPQGTPPSASGNYQQTLAAMPQVQGQPA